MVWRRQTLLGALAALWPHRGDFAGVNFLLFRLPHEKLVQARSGVCDRVVQGAAGI